MSSTGESGLREAIARVVFKADPDKQPWDGDPYTFDEANRRGEWRAEKAWLTADALIDAGLTRAPTDDLAVDTEPAVALQLPAPSLLPAPLLPGPVSLEDQMHTRLHAAGGCPATGSPARGGPVRVTRCEAGDLAAVLAGDAACHYREALADAPQWLSDAIGARHVDFQNRWDLRIAAFTPEDSGFDQDTWRAAHPSPGHIHDELACAATASIVDHLDLTPTPS